VPARFYENSPTIAAVDSTLIVNTATAIVIRSGDVWAPLPADELEFFGSGFVLAPGTAGDPSALFVFGLTPGGENRFARVDPEQLVEASRELEVGVVRVRLPEGVRLTGSSYDDTVTVGGGEQVLVELTAPAGTCTMTSTYGGDAAKQGWTPVDASRTQWVGQATTSDVVKVTCPDAKTAELLVAATTLPTWG